MLTFADFELDERTQELRRAGTLVPLPDKAARVLVHLALHRHEIVTKDALVSCGWGDVAVTDNSVEQVISQLRRLLGLQADGRPFIETVARRGYRLAIDVTRVARASEHDLAALLAPHLAWIEGRAALETLAPDAALDARRAFRAIVSRQPTSVQAQIGLANALAFCFEMTRADARPDVESLVDAVAHAREACQLDPASGEAWATLAFVLHRTGDVTQALAAARRAVSIEPDNWRHHVRLAAVSWGDERLRSATRTLQLLPGFPLAHWLAATVHAARQAFDEAERTLEAGCESLAIGAASVRFGAGGLHWLRGLLRLHRGDADGAMADFARERAGADAHPHLHARESAAACAYALSAWALRRGTRDSARGHAEDALARVPGYPLALAILAASAEPARREEREAAFAERLAELEGRGLTVEAATARAVHAAAQGDAAASLEALTAALAGAPSGSAAWMVPLDPLFAGNTTGAWTRLQALVRMRAA